MYLLLLIYTVLLMVFVLSGCYLSASIKPTHRRTQFAMSFVSGLMLGIAVFHLLPHALYGARSLDLRGLHGGQGGGIDFVAGWLMAGLVSLFLLQRLFHFHQHDFDDEYCADHDHAHTHTAEAAPGSVGVFIGLGLHSVIDGIALAAAVFATYAATEHVGFLPAGLGVFLAILLHKPLDAITIDVFLRKTGLSSTIRYSILTAFSLLCPITAWWVIAGFAQSDVVNLAYVVAALAFSAGIFLCIALSDLLPELHFHTHDRLSMTLALLAGIMLSLAIKLVESEHSHQLDFDVHASAPVVAEALAMADASNPADSNPGFFLTN